MSDPVSGLAGVPERLASVRARIADAGGDLERVTIVAVTKGFGPEAVDAAVAAGLCDIGENYAQSLLAKAASRVRVGADAVRWHFIGTVQRNKVKALAPVVAVWEAVDRSSAGQAIAAHAPGAAVLVEVNTSGEPTKSGCAPEEAAPLVAELRSFGLDVLGLMTVGPAGPPEEARPAFARLARLADDLGLAERSMGMSGDLEVAVQEGATIVRVGTALFGPRPPAAQARR